MQQGIGRARRAVEALRELAIGGTAVGTGINTHPAFGSTMCERLSSETGIEFVEAENHFEAQAAKDAVCEVSGQLRTIALSLSKIASDIRMLASGPRCGIGEIRLPETQPGSSIMPGKVNPVMCEMAIMVAAQVMGNDATIALACRDGQYELNVMMPVMAYNLLESIRLLTHACDVFAERCVAGIEADKERCAAMVEQSLAMCTSLAPLIGYDQAAVVAKKAYESGRTVREVASELGVLGDHELMEALNAVQMTEPK
jgi:fumarate hydratase class II